MHKVDLAQYLQIPGCGLNDQNRDSVPARGKRYFSCPKRPDLLWIFTQPHIKGYMGLFDGRNLKLITYFHLVLRSKFIQLYLLFPVRLHVVMLNQAQEQPNLT